MQDVIDKRAIDLPHDQKLNTMTELAMREFLERVVLISDVKVMLYGGNLPSNQSVVVGVSSLLSDAARSVIRLQGEMYRKYPGASVRVDVTESDVTETQSEFSVLIS
jgi:hypothetical protein